MSNTELPKGWEWCRLGELGDWYGGGTPSKHNPRYWEEGTIPWLSPKDMGGEVVHTTQDHITNEAVNESAVNLIPADSVAIVTRSGILSRTVPVAHIPFATTLNQDMKALRAYEGIDPKWISWYLRSQAHNILKTCSKTGTTVASLSTEALKNTLIPVAPLAEQHPIVDSLERNFSRIENSEKIINRSILRMEFLKRIVYDIALGFPFQKPEGLAPPPSPVDAEDGVLPDIPSSWTWKRLDEIADVVGGVTKDAKKQADPQFQEVPYLRVANIQRGWLDLSQVSSIRVPSKAARDLELKKGDVLFNEGGDRDKLGRGWVWEGQIPGAIHQNHVFRARIRDGIIHPKLLSWYANSMTRWFEANGRQSVNLASISLVRIKKLPVPVPPAYEQAQIVERIEDQTSLLSNSEVLAHQALKHAKALRRSLLSRAFSGQLVPQDPSDEPVSVLLERIRAERTTQTPAKTKRRSTRSPRTKPAVAPEPPTTSTPVPTTTVQQELPL